MHNFNPTPHIGSDGTAIPTFASLIAGKNGSNTKFILVDSSGNLLVSVASVLGNTAVGDNTTTITSAGTAVQLPNVACKAVKLTAHESNAGTVAYGSSTVVAALAGRRGTTIFPTQSSEWIPLSNLNLLYVDSTASSDKVHYTYLS